MNIKRRDLLRYGVAVPLATQLAPHPRTAQAASFEDVASIVRVVQPVLVAGLGVSMTLAGAGPFAPLVSSVGSVVLTSIFSKKDNPSPKVIDNTPSQWQENLKAYIDDKFEQNERNELANAIYSQINWLRLTYNTHQAGALKRSNVGNIGLLPEDKRNELADMLKANHQDFKATIDRVMAQEEHGLSAFIVGAGIVLANDSQLAILDGIERVDGNYVSDSSHSDVYRNYSNLYINHLEQYYPKSFANTPETERVAAQAACLNIIKLWESAETGLEGLITGNLPSNRWDLYKKNSDRSLQPRINVNYKWWSSDRSGILNQISRWKSDDGKTIINVGSSFTNCHIGGRADWCEQIRVTGVNGGGNWWNGFYYYPINKKQQDTFFERDLSAFGTPFGAGSNSHGLRLDGPFQLTLINRENPRFSETGGEMMLYPDL
ncbi:MAG: hypothetical protein AAFR39_05025 [Pseudomonadota bacterium]